MIRYLIMRYHVNFTYGTIYKFILPIIFILSLLLDTSCLRKHYPVSSFPNIETREDNEKLEYFIENGIEKRINSHNSSAEDILTTARTYLGVLHCMGGRTRKCMDCSGLLVTVFAEHGIYLPHNSEEQARYGKIMTGKNDLIEGDLVFFVKSYKTRRLITHSGIYAGNGNFIHTSSSKGVTITSLNDPWWRDKFIFGTRIFE